MARTKNFEDDGEVRVNAENPVEEMTDAVLNGKDAPKPTVTTGVKMVKVRIVEEVDCIIACKPYRFAKDKDASVPADVAAILCHAKKAYRL